MNANDLSELIAADARDSGGRPVGVTPALDAQLYGVSSHYPVSDADFPVLFVVALTACAVLAWRAVTVNPVDGLRQE